MIGKLLIVYRPGAEPKNYPAAKFKPANLKTEPKPTAGPATPVRIDMGRPGGNRRDAWLGVAPDLSATHSPASALGAGSNDDCQTKQADEQVDQCGQCVSSVKTASNTPRAANAACAFNPAIRG